MDDLINRQVAIQGVRELFSMGDCYCDEQSIVGMLNSLLSAQPEQHYEEWCDSCKEYDQEKHSCPRWNKVIRSTVEELKSAQPERKKGKWVEHHEPYTWMGYTYWTCSECGFGEENENKIKFNFCPNCGADMRGEQNEYRHNKYQS